VNHPRIRPLSAAGAAVILAVGCCGGGCRGGSSRAELRRLANRSRASLNATLRFQPPADGVITDAQLERYIRVRRAAKSRSDSDAARAVGIDPDEVAWVRARVDEALIEADSRRVRTASEEVYARTIASLRETRKSVKDPATARSVDDQIAGLERERATLRRGAPAPPAVAENARKVASKRADLETPPGLGRD
jgi:hypothetical protein